MPEKRWRLFLYTAGIIPGTFKEMLKSADKRFMVNAIAVRCGETSDP